MENYLDESPVAKVFDNTANKNKFYVKTFLYFGLAILLTAFVSIIVSIVFSSIWPMSYINDGEIMLNVDTINIYLALLIVSAIVLFILSFVISFKTLKGTGSIFVPYILYSIVMGVMLSCLSFFVGDAYIIGAALGITALFFLGMCGLGYATHGKLAIWARVAIGLSFVIILLCLLNLIIIPFAIYGGNFAYYQANIMIYLITEGVIILFTLVVTAIDMARIRTIAERGIGTNNLALYCALSLYNDFIALLLYVIRVLLVILGSSRRS